MGIFDALKNGFPSKEVTPEEVRKNDLDSKFKSVDGMNENLNKESIKGKQKVKEEKIKILKKVYSEMIAMGIDPGNIEQVSAFMRKLEESDPDLVILFENAINALDPMNDGSKGMPQAAPIQDGAPMMQEQPAQMPQTQAPPMQAPPMQAPPAQMPQTQAPPPQNL